MGENREWTCRKSDLSLNLVVLEVVLWLAGEPPLVVHLAEDHTDHTERMM